MRRHAQTTLHSDSGCDTSCEAMLGAVLCAVLDAVPGDVTLLALLGEPAPAGPRGSASSWGRLACHTARHAVMMSAMSLCPSECGRSTTRTAYFFIPLVLGTLNILIW